MTVPADGIERLIYFVDARIAQLNLSKEEVARRGGPNRDTLAKIRDRKNSRTPSVETLLRLDQTVGWHPGSSAVTLLGGRPLSLNAVGAGVGRPPKQNPPVPVTAGEIQRRLAEQLHDEIGRLQNTRDALDTRIAALRTVYERFVAEMVGLDHVADYQVSYKASAARRSGGRRPSAAI
ncbi:transcriptional regulator [Mycolicibacterium chlorophenolicum]|uniref:Uncharacterized protein n=1 Tax=Mycolicibacterium chlorophenolicum TaxID=37916 RepID=A0A0J6VHP9_9MYCO|nr:transcriptional regulator [Mycolicibacterium chlorophenolicum]KMO69804.1 hypothetical protein MCHLDSM_05916 [Mycolicibacterium chlorophenolicum]